MITYLIQINNFNSNSNLFNNNKYLKIKFHKCKINKFSQLFNNQWCNSNNHKFSQLYNLLPSKKDLNLCKLQLHKKQERLEVQVEKKELNYQLITLKKAIIMKLMKVKKPNQ